MPFRIVSLNIRHGGGRRAGQIVDWLLTKQPSVLVLPEWRNNDAGLQIKSGLVNAGFRSVATARTDSGVNGILVATVEHTEYEKATPPDAAAAALLTVGPVQDLRLLGCYFPQRKAKAAFFKRCAQLADNNRDEPFVLIGDLNTGTNRLDIEGAGVRFDCADLFESLSGKSNLVDLWRARHGDRQEWTWRSPVNGFRVDHCFANGVFINRFPNFECTIDHTPRLSGLTDHSAVILDVRL